MKCISWPPWAPNHPTWHGPFYQFKKDANGNKPDSYSYTSFPWGHTTLAFAAVTVYAMEYAYRPLVPVVAYGAAGLIGLSRITENRHWASDVLIGGILGHLIGRQVVNNYHRYAMIKSEQSQGRWMAGMVYSFR